MKQIILAFSFILFNLTLYCQTTAPNDIPIPWYSQKLDICDKDSWHLCGLASTLMVTDYYDNNPRSIANLQLHMQEINAHFNKSNCSSNYPHDDIVSLAKYKNYPDVTDNISLNKDYNLISSAINKGFPVIVMINYAGVDKGGGMSPGGVAHWVVVRGITKDSIWINNPGTTHIEKGENKCFIIGVETNFHKCWNGHYIVIQGYKKNINSSVDIYAGSVKSPQKLKINFKLKDVTTNYSVSSFKIYDNEKSVTIPSTSIEIDKNLDRTFYVNLKTSQLNGLSNKSYNLSFDINSTSNHFLGQNQIYFIDPTQLTDIKDDGWNKEYIYDGINLGFFKGKNQTTFNPGEILNWAQAAKVVVTASLKLGLFDIDVSTSNGTFDNIHSGNWAFPYVQTLKNKGYIAQNTGFDFNSSISSGQFSKLLCKALELNDTDKNANTLAGGVGIKGSKINHTAVDISVQPYLNRINEILVVKAFIDEHSRIEPLSAGLFPVYRSNIESNEIFANGDNIITRSMMAKTLVNAYNYKNSIINGNNYSVEGNSLKSCNIGGATDYKANSISNLSNYTVIGDKFELTPNPSGNQPVLVSGNINMVGGTTKDLGTNSDYQDGNPLYFYWTVDGGTLNSLLPNHRKVRFTAPNVTSDTDYHMYFLSGTSEGKITEAFITITVIPEGSSNTTVYPSRQASGLDISTSTITSASLNWTRGNGNYCIVTCDDRNNSVTPNANTVYSGNRNLGSAPVISGSTKVVYTGTNDNVIVTGLMVGKTYTFKIYEYNGNTAANIKYLISNPATQTYYTNNSEPLTVDYSWTPTTITTESPVIFENTSKNYTSINWSFEGANISSSTSNTVTNVIFSNPGEYIVTLNATNEGTNESDYNSKLLTVYSANQLLPDLVMKSLNVTPSSILTNNHNIILSYEFANEGVNPATNFYVNAYLSSDNVLSTDDVLLNQSQFESVNYEDTGVFNENIILPSGKSAGTYYIIVKVDYTNNISETNENNNVKSLAFKIVQALPDMVINSITASPTTLSSEREITLSTTLKNIGTEAAIYGLITYVQLIFSTDTIISANDITHNQGIFTGSIDAGKIQTMSTKIPLPTGIPDGNYYIIGKVNPYNDEEELDYNNNVNHTSMITISSPNQPTIQASNFTLTNITDTSVRLGWVNGNGQARIAVASPQICSVPADGESYAANSNFLSAPVIMTDYNEKSKVVYNGTGNFVDITGLTPNTTYYFTVVEYNGTESLINYLQNPATVTSFAGQQIFTVAATIPVVNNGWISSTVNIGFNDVFFSDSLTGYGALNWGRICKTTDGGKTWNYKQLSENDLNTCYFTNENIGWFAGGKGVIYKTTDGGNSWMLQKSSTTYNITDIKFINSSVGFAVSEYYNQIAWVGEILKTVDGGNTWSVCYESSQSLYSLSLVDENTCWVFGNHRIILKTSDGGSNWEIQDTGYTNASGYGAGLFLDSNNGITIGSGGKVLKTLNGGKNWFITDTLINNINSIYFSNSLIGYAVGGTQIHKTVDGGYSWVSANIPLQGNSVFCVTPNLVYVACIDGILKSTTGGQPQFILVPVISQTSFCTPVALSIPYTVSGTFNSENIFRAELSDSAGLFNYPMVIGEFTGSENGMIDCNIPLGISGGANYKIRIIATNPATIGAESNAFMINQTPVVSINGLPDSCFTNIADITLSSLGSPTGGSFKVNGIPATIFSPTTLGTGTHNVEYTYSNGQCSAAIIQAVTVSIPNAINSSINSSAYCAGTIIDITCNVVGSYNSDNQFNVELSDKNGSFSNTQIINTVTTISSNKISCVLPVSTLSGANYKVRVSSTNPRISGVESNGFTVIPAVFPSVYITAGDSEICEGSPVSFIASQTNGGTASFQWSLNGMNVGNNSSIYSTSALQNLDIVQVQMTSNVACAYPSSILSNPVSVIVDEIVTPSVYVEADKGIINKNDTVDIWSYVENEGSNPTYQWTLNGKNLPTSEPYLSTDTLTHDALIILKLISNANCIDSNPFESTDTIKVFVSNIEAPENLPLTNLSLIDGSINCYNALQTITVAGSGTTVDFESGSTVDLIAGQSITFLPGFYAHNGSQMNAWITIDGTFCDGSPSPIVAQHETKSIEKNNNTTPDKPDLYEKSVKVYPNPNNGKFTVELENFENAIITIYSISGTRILQSQVHASEKLPINLPNLKNGIYFLQVTENNKMYTRKFIVNEIR
jgi:photosystem II stability/assembly factor-like uncharacterized protein